MIKPSTVVEVVWIDSYTIPGWVKVDELERELDADGLLECKSVGYILKETDEYLAIVSSTNPQQAETTTAIPKVCIKSITTLRRRKK